MGKRVKDVGGEKMRVLEVARKRGHGSPEVERQRLVKSRGRKSSDNWAGRPRHTWPALPFASPWNSLAMYISNRFLVSCSISPALWLQ